MKQLEKKDVFQERKELIQDVIDREVKYGESYKQALKEFNQRFPVTYVENNYARVSSKFKETT